MHTSCMLHDCDRVSLNCGRRKDRDCVHLLLCGFGINLEDLVCGSGSVEDRATMRNVHTYRSLIEEL